MSRPTVWRMHPCDTDKQELRAESHVSEHPPVVIPEVTVRVLGPVDVLGGDRPMRRAWTLDLVAYLALHPRGATSDQWTSALWPDGAIADATRHSTVSVARRALGRASDGTDHLPRSVGRLRLARSVTSDWAQFCALAATTGPACIAAWESALALVRGRPLEGLRVLDWALFDGTLACMEESVVDVASRLAEHHIAAGDGRAAARALRRALAVSPYDERLYRLLLRAADRQGNSAGVEAVMWELTTLLGGPGSGHDRRHDPLDLEAVHPETAALYLSLSRRNRAGRRRVLRPAER